MPDRLTVFPYTLKNLLVLNTNMQNKNDFEVISYYYKALLNAD